MQSDLLNGRLAKTIGKVMSGLFLDATLSRDVPGTVDPDQPWLAPSTTTETYACKAIHEEWNAYLLAGGLVQAGERKVLVLASTLAVEPVPGDKITIRGETFTIVPKGSGQAPVSTDPAKATWMLRASA